MASTCSRKSSLRQYLSQVKLLKAVALGVFLTSLRQEKDKDGTSLVAQLLRIRLPMQGTQVRALVQEDPTCRGATKPMRHNY
ncbi:hypothetical protein J1605_012162 [Eschrichtius robustus]|uniref:Uncharacterized protein n=1 Tax=Eschrichtius robustus TaxID=9764 RepID=A0AB34GLK0_ESCRO|nr:hypothetical protein J1605_012162 [Eschrichtius robustus]